MKDNNRDFCLNADKTHVEQYQAVRELVALIYEVEQTKMFEDVSSFYAGSNFLWVYHLVSCHSLPKR